MFYRDFFVTLTLVAVTLANASSVEAVSVAINFNSVPSSGNPSLTNLTTDGFSFTADTTVPGANLHFHIIDDPNKFPCAGVGNCVDNGTVYIGEEAGDPASPFFIGAPIIMSRVSGLPFSLHSFDGAELLLPNFVDVSGFTFQAADFIDLVGIQEGGGTLTASFGLDGVRDGIGGLSDFQTFTLPQTWMNLTSVTFSGSIVNGGTGAIALDNIAAITTPEPGSLLLLASGLAGMAGWRMRKRT